MKEIDRLINFCMIYDVKKQLKATFPTLIVTRWVYLCDVLIFLKKSSRKDQFNINISKKIPYHK